MIIDIVLVTTTLAIAALISAALWRAFRRESTQIRRIVGLALAGAASITLAKLVQLVVLVSTTDAGSDAMIARYADIGSSVVVAVGMALLAVSLLDMVMFGRSLWPSGDGTMTPAGPGSVAGEGSSRAAPGTSHPVSQSRAPWRHDSLQRVS